MEPSSQSSLESYNDNSRMYIWVTGITFFAFQCFILLRFRDSDQEEIAWNKTN